jgi:mannose-6-phosphate isomerase-like protein (cupin superfamily)
MGRTVILAAGAALLCAPAAMVAQTKAATYITKEEVDVVNKQPGTDRTIRVLDIGHENFAVGIIHRGPTGGGRGGAGAAVGGGAGRGAAAPAEPCGEKAASPPPAGTPTGLYHDSQTEGYYIVSGGGTMVTGGRIVNGRRSAPDAAVTTTLNGPSCSGSILGADVVTREVKAGDIIIIPAGVPHGWSNIPDHVDYLSFRPSQRVLTAGYVHPSIAKWAGRAGRARVESQESEVRSLESGVARVGRPS